MDARTALYPPSFTPPEGRLGVLAFLSACVKNPLATVPAVAYREFVAVLEARGRKAVWLTDPALIERVLVTDADKFVKTELERRVFDPVLGDGVLTANGQSWRWQRRALAPLFRHSELLGYVPDMIAAGDAQIARWRSRLGPRPSRPQSIDADMTETTYDIIVRTMLHGGAPDDVGGVMDAGSRYLEGTPWVIAYSLLGLPQWMPHPAMITLRRAARSLRRHVGAIIDERRRKGGETRDLLGRLLAARDPDTGAPMTREQLIDNVATLLEAGHETTAKALTWSLYLLAMAPDWQDKARAQVIAVTDGGQLMAEHLDRLDVIERILKEAMRLYPPAVVISRTAQERVDLAGTVLEPHHTVFVPLYALHRHTRLWEDPGRFDPDRFLPAAVTRIPRTQYMPFGAGPRSCIGSSFAMIEAKVLLARFLAAARFSWPGGPAPEPVSRVTLRPANGLSLGVELLA
ncbi:MAG: cytochrome P450 [Hyphomicrobiaceae bacterium]